MDVAAVVRLVMSDAMWDRIEPLMPLIWSAGEGGLTTGFRADLCCRGGAPGTLPMMVGAWPLRVWFASVVAVLPAVLHLALFRHSHTAPAVIYACTGLNTVACRTAYGAQKHATHRTRRHGHLPPVHGNVLRNPRHRHTAVVRAGQRT
ncbi:hypothetical protein ABZ865_33900 [Streptomyces sp. NPDC047085]|uniref:hypothetical protein n=1 Tax=Streptomyces sp. NPDC047085 TaxID=3155140 RepID=UPI0033EE485D